MSKSMHHGLIRIFDIVLSMTGLVLSLPIMLVIICIGYAESRSPLFFQQRVGRIQQPFTLIKFRTMKPETHSVGTHLVDREAVTRLGAFLRRTKLDELPQLINVFRGDMSLVGPRPCLFNQNELIAERASRNVFASKPGITGLAQVNDIDMSTPRKLARYDELMLRHMNINLYFRLVVATLFGQGHGDRVRR